MEGRQHMSEVTEKAVIRENLVHCKEKDANGERGPAPHSLLVPSRDLLRSLWAGRRTHPAGYPPRRGHRRPWTWLSEEERKCFRPPLRTWRDEGTPAWAWVCATAALLAWFSPALARPGGCPAHAFPPNRTCPSMYLRNLAHLQQLCSCVKVSGCLHISLISSESENSTRYLRSFSFPHLREITDYLLVYRVWGLTSLATLFPNLSVIRGEMLFFNYALVIRNLPQLEEVGLLSLTAVLRGSVRVENNPRLCYAHTVDWDAITSCRLGRNIVKRNRAQSECAPCHEQCRGARQCDRARCWNEANCQILCSEGCQGRCVAGQTSGSNTNTTTATTSCAHPACAVHAVHGACPSPSSQALTSSQRVQSGEGHLGPSLEGDELVPGSPCSEAMKSGASGPATPKGRQWCGCKAEGDDSLCQFPKVHSVSEAQCLTHCHSVGNLTIYYTGGELIDNELQKYLWNIVEIRGYLKILKTSIASARILPNLQRIRGEHKVYNRFSLVVLDNPLLQSLDPWTHNLTVESGGVLFQRNPRLCIGHIRQLSDKMKLPAAAAVSATNGREILCQMETLKVTVRPSPLYGELEVFLDASGTEPEPSNTTYYVSYREASGNTSISFSRDSCFDDLLWTVVEVSRVEALEEQPLVLLKGLSPATRYALYVSTVNARSAIVTTTTTLFNVSQPAEVEWRSLSDSSLLVWWKPPPLPPNVTVDQYLVTVLLRPSPRSPTPWDPARGHKSSSRSSERRNSSTSPSEDSKEICSLPAEPGCCSCHSPALQERVLPPHTADAHFEEHLVNSITIFSVLQGEATSPPTPSDSFLHGDDIREEDLLVYSSVLRQWQALAERNPQLVPVVEHCISHKGSWESCRHESGVREGKKIPGRYLQHNTSALISDSRLVTHHETSDTSLTLHSLRHFSLYTVAITACLQPQPCMTTQTPALSLTAATPGLLDPVYCKLCSTFPAVVTAFTEPSPSADVVPEQSLEILPSNTSSSVMVSWLPPTSVNGMIIHYVLQCIAGQGVSGFTINKLAGTPHLR